VFGWRGTGSATAALLPLRARGAAPPARVRRRLPVQALTGSVFVGWLRWLKPAVVCRQACKLSLEPSPGVAQRCCMGFYDACSLTASYGNACSTPHCATNKFPTHSTPCWDLVERGPMVSRPHRRLSTPDPAKKLDEVILTDSKVIDLEAKAPRQAEHNPASSQE